MHNNAVKYQASAHCRESHTKYDLQTSACFFLTKLYYFVSLITYQLKYKRVYLYNENEKKKEKTQHHSQKK